MGGFRFNPGCCCGCKCTWKNTEWDIEGEPFEWSNNTDSVSSDFHVVEDDGTPITCKYRIKPNRTPCLEWEYQSQLTQDTEWETWNAGYFFGETYPDWVWYPNGNDANLRYRVDARAIYSEIRMEDGNLWEAQDEIMDASIPNQAYKGTRFACMALMKQGDHYFYYGAAQFQGVGKEPPDYTYNTGDWAWYEQEFGDTFANANCFTTGRYSVDGTIKPNLAADAPPIYFGWAAGHFSSQTPVFSIDKYLSFHLKTRIDYLCINITEIDAPWNPTPG